MCNFPPIWALYHLLDANASTKNKYFPVPPSLSFRNFLEKNPKSLGRKGGEVLALLRAGADSIAVGGFAALGIWRTPAGVPAPTWGRGRGTGRSGTRPYGENAPHERGIDWG